jgi:hypothetical protein
VNHFFFHPHGRLLLRRAVHPLVGDLAQPAAYLDAGSDDIELQTALAQATCQRHVKRPAQVAVKARDLALGLGAIRLAQLDPEAAVLGEVKEAGVETVLAFAVHVALDDDRLHVVVQDLARHTAECSEGALMAADQCGHLHVADELDIAGTAVAHRGAERMQGRAAFAELDPIEENSDRLTMFRRLSRS